MAAFDKVKSGFPQMDEILDHIRMGDNVVWQVSDIDEFRIFALPFVDQAIRDKRNVIYIRFAHHAPILDETDGVYVAEFDPDEGFEAFKEKGEKVPYEDFGMRDGFQIDVDEGKIMNWPEKGLYLKLFIILRFLKLLLSFYPAFYLSYQDTRQPRRRCS